MAAVQIESTTLKQLQKDASLAKAIRKAVKNGAHATTARPGQTIIMQLSRVSQDDREPLQAAWAAVFE